MDSIYQYDDFRLFCSDRYNAMQQQDPGLTARGFARMAGISNPGFLNDVIKGRRTLSRTAAQKLCTAFGLAPSECAYFGILVDYGQCKDDAQREALLKKMLFRRSRSEFCRTNPAATRYYQNFYYPLIRNALMVLQIHDQYDTLGTFIHPPLSASLTKKYVDDLISWGLVVRTARGTLQVTNRFIEPRPTLQQQVKQLNRAWIEHGRDALMSLPVEKRHISSMLLSVSTETARTIKEKIEALREEIWTLMKEDTKPPELIMQLNMQYFPRSKTKDTQ
jgi:uncharacterized protein (TIGR02147 family)